MLKPKPEEGNMGDQPIYPKESFKGAETSSQDSMEVGGKEWRNSALETIKSLDPFPTLLQQEALFSLPGRRLKFCFLESIK